MNRDAMMVNGKLLGQWWCVPVDQTLREKVIFLKQVRATLGDDFDSCPLEYIEDRLYGGFKCEDVARRHVYFAVAEYSFIAAELGEFWANHPGTRFNTREKLFNDNLATHIGDGPFTEVRDE